jgi:hypothetical protein
MPEPDRGVLASASLPAHLARGAIGFGLIGAAFALTPSHGPLALLFAPIGVVALRGCPTCWIVGLVETISVGRLERTCSQNGCTLDRPSSGTADEQKPKTTVENESDAVPGRLRNPPQPTRRPSSLGGAASHLGGLALCDSVPRLDSK